VPATVSPVPVKFFGTRSGSGPLALGQRNVPRNVEADFGARSLRVWQVNRDAVRDWQPSPYSGPIHTFGLPPITALPATVVQLTHECGTDGRLAGAFRELIG
jgi:hypothetical protein